MKLTQQRVNLIKELDLRAEFVCEMIGSYCAAISARRMNISPSENDPDIFRQGHRADLVQEGRLA